MKREDLKADTEYATNLGVHVKVVDVETIGWSVIKGEWVEAPSQGQRFVKGKGFVPYQNNVTIRAIDMETGDRIVVEPRHLVSEWKDYVATARAEIKREKTVKQNAAALQKRAKSAGFTVTADPRKEEVRVPFSTFDDLLRLAKV